MHDEHYVSIDAFNNFYWENLMYLDRDAHVDAEVHECNLQKPGHSIA